MKCVLQKASSVRISSPDKLIMLAKEIKNHQFINSLSQLLFNQYSTDRF